jgi:putative FmdB family regulatory protein
MPIYEYRRPDGSTFEMHQAFSEDSLTTDPDTGVAVERVLHAPAVHFKGKGFYNTDYGTRKRQRENAASTDGSSSGSSGDSSSGDSSSGEGSSDSSSKGDSAAKTDTKKSESNSKPAEKTGEASRPGTPHGGGQAGKPVPAAK